MAPVEYYPGIFIDRETKEFSVLGHRMAVAQLTRYPYTPEHHRRPEDYTPEFISLMEEIMPGWLARPVSRSPHAIHASLLCGENGWWVEVSIYPGDPEYGPGMMLNLPGPGAADCREHWKAQDLLDLWLRTCARTDAVPEEEGDHVILSDPFGGMTPGTWLWDEDE